ncbi:ABC transporter permease [Reyranella sp.]|uniref:ABC transporter permease n=1 Tax=Reyranella sp. TaxID=1929291 RepID=UPI002F929980
MTFPSLLIQFLNGLTDASSLFLVSAGLSLIFGVTRIVNFAHGSLYMLGLYAAYSLIQALGHTPLGFWAGVILATLAVGVIGVVIEVLVLRRIYHAPELFQLLATFAIVLIVKDAALYAWGSEDLVGPRAPGLTMAVDILGKRIPAYDLLLIAVGPLMLGLLWLLLARTRWGALVRAATQDREMVGALGVDQAKLFTSVFFVGAALAGFGGALQIPREPANLDLDLSVIADAFVVTVVGGLGSLPGALLAAVLIGVAKALCIGIGTVSLFALDVDFSRLVLVVEFVIMGVVLVLRPYGLLGKPPVVVRAAATVPPPLGPPRWPTALAWIALLLAMPLLSDDYVAALLIDIACFALFAVSLHFIMGPAGMISFGHAAYFGLGAYAGAVLLKRAGLPMEVAFVSAPFVAAGFAILYGWFCVRLSGVYLAMLTLAFAQITWSIVFQWDSLTAGSNGMVGIWPAVWLSGKTAYYYLTMAFCGLGVAFLWRVLFSPFGYTLRAARDSPLRAEAIGIDVRGFQWAAFVLAGGMAGLAGVALAFSKGSISPSAASISQSTDGLVMVLLGGVETLTGPVVGAGLFTWLRDLLARETDYWRAVFGLVILLIVVLFPQGLVGGLKALLGRWQERSA